MAQHILVPFRGEGSGVEELSWGQRAIWTELQYTGVSLSLGGIMALPPGTTVDAVAMVLRFAVERHESLRTRLRFGPDGQVRQEVSAAGETPLVLVDVADLDRAGEAAAQLRARWQEENFDYEHEFPVRMGVVRWRGNPTHVVVMYCHLAFDGHGFDVMTADLAQLDRQTGLAGTPTAAAQPRDLARRQRTAAARRQSETSLRFWERLLRAAPARRFPRSTDPRTPRFWEASLTSAAMRLAVRRIAARHEVDPAPVLLAAFAVTAARITGINPVLTQVLVSNRFRAGLSDTVSPVMQAGLCLIDVADAPFAEVVGRAWQASMGAYLNAYYDPVRRDELVAAIGRERGEEIDISCFYNDRRRPAETTASDVDTGGGSVPTAEQIVAALAGTRLEWVVEMDRTNRTLFFHLDDVPEGLHILMNVDTHYVSPADLESWLRGVEDVLVTESLAVTSPS